MVAILICSGRWSWRWWCCWKLCQEWLWWTGCWTRMVIKSPGCWRRSMMSTSLTHAALCLTSILSWKWEAGEGKLFKGRYSFVIFINVSLLRKCDLGAKLALLQGKPLPCPEINHIMMIMIIAISKIINYDYDDYNDDGHLLFLQTWTIPNPPEPSCDSHSQSPSILCKESSLLWLSIIILVNMKVVHWCLLMELNCQRNFWILVIVWTTLVGSHTFQ